MAGTLQLLGEIWDSSSGWEKGGMIAAGALILLGTLASLSDDRTIESADIPTISQIQDAKEKQAQLEKDLKDLAERDSSAEGADRWEQQLQEALKNIESYRHELFAPGAVKTIQEALKDAEDFRTQKQDQAAAYTLYQAWLLARTTQLQVLEGERGWENASVTYLTIHGSLQNVFKSVPETQVQLTTDCGKEPLIMDADYWSQGRVAELQKSMPGQEIPRDLTVEQVQERTGQLRKLAEDLNQAITDAVDSFRSSLQRMELCEAVHASFADRGWRLDEAAENGFEKGDPRCDAALHLLNAARDEVTFTFSGADRLEAKTSFRGVYNRDLEEYLSQLLRQVLQENGFIISRLTSSIS